MEAKVTRKGQVTIPKEIRRELKLEGGDRVVFIRERGGVQMVPLESPEDPLADLKGSLATKKSLDELKRRAIGVAKDEE